MEMYAIAVTLVLLAEGAVDIYVYRRAMARLRVAEAQLAALKVLVQADVVARAAKSYSGAGNESWRQHVMSTPETRAADRKRRGESS